MKSVKEMNMEELVSYVCTALENEGIDTVLSGLDKPLLTKLIKDTSVELGLSY